MASPPPPLLMALSLRKYFFCDFPLDNNQGLPLYYFKLIVIDKNKKHYILWPTALHTMCASKRVQRVRIKVFAGTEGETESVCV